MQYHRLGQKVGSTQGGIQARPWPLSAHCCMPEKHRSFYHKIPDGTMELSSSVCAFQRRLQMIRQLSMFSQLGLAQSIQWSLHCRRHASWGQDLPLERAKGTELADTLRLPCRMPLTNSSNNCLLLNLTCATSSENQVHRSTSAVARRWKMNDVCRPDIDFPSMGKVD